MSTLLELAPRDAGELLDELEVEFSEELDLHVIQDCGGTHYCGDASRICWATSS